MLAYTIAPTPTPTPIVPIFLTILLPMAYPRFSLPSSHFWSCLYTGIVFLAGHLRKIHWVAETQENRHCSKFPNSKETKITKITKINMPPQHFFSMPILPKKFWNEKMKILKSSEGVLYGAQVWRPSYSGFLDSIHVPNGMALKEGQRKQLLSIADMYLPPLTLCLFGESFYLPTMFSESPEANISWRRGTRSQACRF